MPMNTGNSPFNKLSIYDIIVSGYTGRNNYLRGIKPVSCINAKKIQTTKSRLVFAFLLCFVIEFILSTAFIMTHAGHEHDRKTQIIAALSAHRSINLRVR